MRSLKKGRFIDVVYTVGRPFFMDKSGKNLVPYRLFDPLHAIFTDKKMENMWPFKQWPHAIECPIIHLYGTYFEKTGLFYLHDQATGDDWSPIYTLAEIGHHFGVIVTNQEKPHG